MNRRAPIAPAASVSPGFTLVEMLVAILIFAIMTGVAYRALTGVLESRERLDRDGRKWREVSLLFARMKQDLSMTMLRPVRDSGGLVASSFSAAPGPGLGSVGNFDALLVFTRSGEASRSGAPASPRRVGYRLRRHAVELLLWPVLDQAPLTAATIDPLLEEVAELRFRYLDAAGGWHENWPPAEGAKAPGGRDASLPAAVEVTLGLDSGERLVRLFALPVLSGGQ